MAERRFTVRLDAEMNISQVKSAVQTMQTELGKLNLPQDVGSKLTGTFDKLTGEIEKFQAMSAKGIGSSKDFNQLARSGDKILQLYEQLRNQINGLGGMSDSQLSKMIPPSALANIKKATDAFKTYKSEIERSQGAIQKQQGAIKSLEGEISGLEKEMSRVQKMNIVGNTTELNKMGKEVASAKNELDGLEQEAQQVKDKMAQMESTMASPRKSSKYRDLQTQLEGLGPKIEQARNNYQNLQNQFSNTTTVQKQTTMLKTLGSDLENARGRLNTMNQELANMQANDGSAALQNLVNALNQIPGINIDPTTASLEQIQQVIAGLASGEINKLRSSFAQAGNQVNSTKGQFDLFNKEIDETRGKVNQLDSQMGEMDMLKSRITYFFGLTNSVYLLRRALTSAMETVKELDKTMTEAAVVTDFSVSDMWEKLPEYTKEASALGTTINDLYSATTLYYQQGLKSNEAMELGVETMKMARIAGMDSAEATEAMTAALRGFNMELTETSAIRVNDVYSQLAAITASDTEQIATAMTKTASIAHSANMEFETTAALLAQIIETTQEAPETAGTALKTIIARFSEVKKLRSSGELTGEDEEGEIIDVNKIDTALKSVGISMENFFAGTEGLDDVLLRLAEKWDGLDFETQRYIATMAAGSRQQSRFIAMMSDYARTTELVEAASNSAGASQKQFQKTLDSLESKLNKLKNEWDRFTMGLADNELLKAGVDFLTDVLKVVNNLTDSIAGEGGLLKSVINLGVAFGALKAGGFLLTKGLGFITGIGKGGMNKTSQLEHQKRMDNLSIEHKQKMLYLAQEHKQKLQYMAQEAKTAVIGEQQEATTAVEGEYSEKFAALEGEYTEAMTAAMGEEEEAAAAVEGEFAEKFAALEGEYTEALAGVEGEFSEKIAAIESESAEAIAGVEGEIVELEAAIAGETAESAAGAGKAALGKSLGKSVLIGAIIAGAAVAISGLAKAMDSWEQAGNYADEIEQIDQQISEFQDVIADATAEIQELGSAQKNLTDMQETFSGLTKGSNEWKQQLIQINQTVLDLMEKYPELARYVTRGQNGELQISEEGWTYMQNESTQRMYAASMGQMGAQIQKNELQEQQAFYDSQTEYYQNAIKYKEFLGDEDTAIGAGNIVGGAAGIGGAIAGAKIGAGMGTFGGPIGTVIGLAAGLIVGGLVGYFGTKATDELTGEEEDIYNDASGGVGTDAFMKFAAAAAERGVSVSAGSSREEFLEIFNSLGMSGDFEKVYDHVQLLGTGFDKLANQALSLSTAQESYVASLLTTSAQANDYLANHEYQDQIITVHTMDSEQITGEIEKLKNEYLENDEYVDKDGNATDELINKYAATMQITADEVRQQIKDGALSAETMVTAVATKEVADEATDDMQKTAQELDRLNRNFGSLSAASQELKKSFQGLIRLLSTDGKNLTKGDLANFEAVAGISVEDLIALQETNPDKATEYINTYLASLNTSLDQLGMSGSDFIQLLSGGFNAFANADSNAKKYGVDTTGLDNVSAENYSQLINKVVEQLLQATGTHDPAEIMQQLMKVMPTEVEDANTFLTTLLNLDWDSIGSIEGLSDIVGELGITTNGTAEDMDKLENSLISFSGAVNKVNFADVKDEVEDLLDIGDKIRSGEQGRTFSEEDYNKMPSYLKKDFVYTGDKESPWVYIGDNLLDVAEASDKKALDLLEDTTVQAKSNFQKMQDYAREAFLHNGQVYTGGSYSVSVDENTAEATAYRQGVQELITGQFSTDRIAEAQSENNANAAGFWTRMQTDQAGLEKDYLNWSNYVVYKKQKNGVEVVDIDATNEALTAAGLNTIDGYTQINFSDMKDAGVSAGLGFFGAGVDAKTGEVYDNSEHFQQYLFGDSRYGESAVKGTSAYINTMGAYNRIASNTATTDDLTNYSKFVKTGTSGQNESWGYKEIIEGVAKGTIIENTAQNRQQGKTTVGNDVLRDILVKVFGYAEETVKGMDWTQLSQAVTQGWNTFLSETGQAIITQNMANTLPQFQGLYSSYGSTQDILTGNLIKDYETWLNTSSDKRGTLGYSKEITDQFTNWEKNGIKPRETEYEQQGKRDALAGRVYSQDGQHVLAQMAEDLGVDLYQDPNTNAVSADHARQIRQNQDLVYAQAAAYLENSEAIETAANQLSQYTDVLTKSNRGTVAYQKALSKIQPVLQSAFKVNNIDADFMRKNADIIEDVIAGVDGSWERLQTAITTDVFEDYAAVAEESGRKIQTTYNQAVDAALNLAGVSPEIGIATTYDPTGEYAARMGLARIGEDIIANEANLEYLKEMYSGLGYTMTYTTKTMYQDPANPSGPLSATNPGNWTAVEIVDTITTTKNDTSPIDNLGGSGGGGNDTKWENPYDEYYNSVKKINAELRKREQLERQYSRLLDRNAATANNLAKNQKDQLASLRSEYAQRKTLKGNRERQMQGIESEYSDLSKYAWYDEELGQVQIDWKLLEGLDGSTDEELTERVEEYISKLEEQQDLIEQEQDEMEEIEDAIWEIYEQGKDEYFDLEDQIKEAIIADRQKEIDKLSEINDTITDTNSKLLDSMQQQLDEYRQNRDNEKTEEELSDKQRKLAYLQQDTSGANALEIMQLQEELDEATEDYTDTLIDQKISELQEQNDKAAEQRQQQIDIMQAQLDQYSDSAAIWEEVNQLMAEGLDKDTGLIRGSRLEELLKSADGFDGMSKLKKMDWLNELNGNVAQALAWLETGALQTLFGQGKEVTFKDKNGNIVTGTINKDGDVEVKDKDGNVTGVYSGDSFKVDAEGNITSSEGSEEATANWEASQVKEPEKKAWSYSWPMPSTGSKTLKKGSTGNRVKGLQQALNDLGFRAGKIDGIFGSNTYQAVRAFQRAAKEWYPEVGSDDGKVGPNTRAAFASHPLYQFKTGGLADFTGPAWLDGTKSKPEYILNADQTKAFFTLVDVLSGLQTGTSKSSEKTGDNTYDIDINVETIGSDYDVEQLATTVKRLINEDARYRNNNTINLTR